MTVEQRNLLIKLIHKQAIIELTKDEEIQLNKLKLWKETEKLFEEQEWD